MQKGAGGDQSDGRSGQVSATLAEIGDMVLVVIDAITAYLGDVDSHRNAKIRALLAPLSDLAARH
jgi:putative DNA primase/helicase